MAALPRSSGWGLGASSWSGGAPASTEMVELTQPPSAQDMQRVHPKLRAGCNRRGGRDGWAAGAWMTEVFSG